METIKYTGKLQRYFRAPIYMIFLFVAGDVFVFLQNIKVGQPGHQQLGLQLLPERLQHPASVLHRPVGGSGRCHCAAEKRQRQGAGRASPHHGRLLLPDYHLPAHQERRAAALCVPAHL